MFKRSATKGRPSRAARRMDWGAAQAQVDLTAFSCTAAYVLLPTDVRTFFTDPTLIRTLMSTTMLSFAGTTGLAGTVGVGLIAWDDINDTPDDVPCPITDANLDWVIRHIHPVPTNEPVNTLVTFPQLDMMFESKAMRRLGNTKGLLLAFENASFGGWSFATDVRFLVKE